MFFNTRVAFSLNYYYSVWLLISFLLLVRDTYQPLTTVRSAVNKISIPILYTAHKPTQIFSEAHHRWISWKTTYEENKQLKAQLLELKVKLKHQQSTIQENKYLHQLLKSTTALRPYTVTLAYLMQTNNTVGACELLVRSNPQEAIQAGHIVLDEKGIMGQVIESNATISRVLCINDTRSAVPVEISRHRLRGILVGQGPNALLSLQYIVKTADVKVGDYLTTSGLGGRYPRGYPVARITSIEDDATEPYLKISAAPMAALSSNGPLLVLQVKST